MRHRSTRSSLYHTPSRRTIMSEGEEPSISHISRLMKSPQRKEEPSVSPIPDLLSKISPTEGGTYQKGVDYIDGTPQPEKYDFNLIDGTVLRCIRESKAHLYDTKKLWKCQLFGADGSQIKEFDEGQSTALVKQLYEWPGLEFSDLDLDRLIDSFQKGFKEAWLNDGRKINCRTDIFGSTSCRLYQDEKANAYIKLNDPERILKGILQWRGKPMTPVENVKRSIVDVEYNGSNIVGEHFYTATLNDNSTIHCVVGNDVQCEHRVPRDPAAPPRSPVPIRNSREIYEIIRRRAP